jgi:DNA-directed RNA polymerase subunit M/transcription elongation factor TFIIS
MFLVFEERHQMETIEKLAITVGEAGNESEELLRKLIKKGVLQLKPTLDKTAVRYLEAEEAWNANPSQVKIMLDDLMKRNLLRSEPLDRVLTCPHCGSPDVHSKYACPRCKSDNVGFTELLEHTKCGNIGPKDTFVKGTFLVCPRCQSVLTEGGPDNRIIGNFYQCEKCGYRFDRPDVVHLCMNCGTTSTHQTAKYVKVFRYTIPDEIAKELQRELPALKNLKKTLTDRGFKVQTRARVKGVSGAESVFDILAEKDRVRLVFDVSTTGDKNDIIGLLAKKVDVNPTRAAIIDLSGSDVQTSLGKVYDVVVFKTTADHAAVDGFEKFLAMFETKSTSKTKS